MMMASIVTLPVLVFTMCLALLPIALLVVLQVFLCRKSRKLGLILPVLSLVLSFVLTSVALINCVTPAAAATMTTVDENGQMVEEVIPQPDFYPPTGGRDRRPGGPVSHLQHPHGGLWRHLALLQEPPRLSGRPAADEHSGLRVNQVKNAPASGVAAGNGSAFVMICYRISVSGTCWMLCFFA